MRVVLRRSGSPRPHEDQEFEHERVVARRLRRGGRYRLSVVVEVALVLLGLVGLWAFANFDRSTAGTPRTLGPTVKYPELAHATGPADMLPPSFVLLATPPVSLPPAPSDGSPPKGAAIDNPAGDRHRGLEKPATPVPELAASGWALKTTVAADVSRPARPVGPSASEILRDMTRARELIRAGDIAGARLLLARAAEGKDARALFSLAETYDPVVLARWRVIGIPPDAAQAKALYREAGDLENTAGEHLLARR
jgi:hypothetical protein